jgi:hypothetical protein
MQKRGTQKAHECKREAHKRHMKGTGKAHEMHTKATWNAPIRHIIGT